MPANRNPTTPSMRASLRTTGGAAAPPLRRRHDEQDQEDGREAGEDGQRGHRRRVAGLGQPLLGGAGDGPDDAVLRRDGPDQVDGRPIPAMNTTAGTTKRARSLKSPTLGVGPGCAQSANAMAGTVAPKNESMADCRGAKGNPPIDMMMAIIAALKKMRTMKIAQDVVHAVDDPLALAEGVGERGERVLHEDEVADAAGGLAAALHGHGDVGLLERDDVVDAVADHRDVAPAVAQGLHEVLLLLGRDAAEDAGLVGLGGEVLGSSSASSAPETATSARSAGASAAASPAARSPAATRRCRSPCRSTSPRPRGGAASARRPAWRGRPPSWGCRPRWS